MRRRACGDAAVFVIRAAVAWAHEKLGIGHPPHRAAEVRAIRGERDELLLAFTAEPRGRFRRNAGPRQRRWIFEVDDHGFADVEVTDFAYREPCLGRFAKN